jgi:transcriptional regulator with XRE-family HTH domain
MKNNYTEKESKILKKLGDNVRKYREALDISQDELAWQVELDRSYISDIENGKRNVSVLVMTRLCKVLKVSIQDLTGL